MIDSNFVEETEGTVFYEINESRIPMSKISGYINVTAICQACNKRVNNYLRTDETLAFLMSVSIGEDIPIEQLTVVKKGGIPEEQGTWAHPLVAVNLAQWAHPDFAYQVSKWVFSWSNKGIVPNISADALFNPSDTIYGASASIPQSKNTPTIHSFPLEQVLMATNIYTSLLDAYKTERSVVSGMSDTEKKLVAESRTNLLDITRQYLTTLRNDLLPHTEDIKLNVPSQVQKELKQSYELTKKANDMVSVNQRQEELFLSGDIPRQLTYEEISKVGKKASKSFQAKYHHYPSRIKVSYPNGSVGNVNCYFRSDVKEIVDPHINSIFGILSVINGYQEDASVI